MHDHTEEGRSGLSINASAVAVPVPYSPSASASCARPMVDVDVHLREEKVEKCLMAVPKKRVLLSCYMMVRVGVRC